jgi:hypothetical protein
LDEWALGARCSRIHVLAGKELKAGRVVGYGSAASRRLAANNLKVFLAQEDEDREEDAADADVERSGQPRLERVFEKTDDSRLGAVIGHSEIVGSGCRQLGVEVDQHRNSGVAIFVGGRLCGRRSRDIVSLVDSLLVPHVTSPSL